MPRRVPRRQHDLRQHGSSSAAWRGGGVSSFPQSGSKAGLAARAGASRAPLYRQCRMCVSSAAAKTQSRRRGGLGRRSPRRLGPGSALLAGKWAGRQAQWRGPPAGSVVR
eukprot:189980-Pleurochrysis_carterae.AAC.1